MRITEGMKKAFEALGCRPLVCHACADPLNVGDKVGPNEGYFVHDACRTKPITLPMDPAVKAKLLEELEAIGGMAAVLSGKTGDWQSKTATKGPAFSFEEVMDAMKGVRP